MELVSGNAQTRPRVPTGNGIDMAQFDPLIVRVTGRDGTPLTGVDVTFTSNQPAGMAVQMEPSGASPCIVTTDAQGIATLAKMGGYGVVAYYADGPFTVTASYGAATQTFALTVGAPMVRTLQAAIVSGDNQSVPRTGHGLPGGEAYFAPLQLRVTWSDGAPAAGVAVHARGEGAPGMAVQLEPSGAPVGTFYADANGVVTIDHMAGSSVRVYYAEGPFSVIASVDGGPDVTFHLVAAPSPPPPPAIPGAVMTIVRGDHQTHARLPGVFGNTGVAEFDPMAVRVTTSDGSPLAAVDVTFSAEGAPGMAVQLEPSGASPCIVTTDAEGLATLDKMIGYSIFAYYADGDFTVRASYGDATQTFSFTVGEPMVQSLRAEILRGDDQTVVRSGRDVPGGMAYFAPLQLRVTLSDGAPAAGVAVHVRGEGAPGMAVDFGDTSPYLTDDNGVVTIDRMVGSSVRAYYEQGPFTVVASVEDGPEVTFHLTVGPTPPPPPPIPGARMELVSGNEQTRARSATGDDIPMAHFDPLVVRVTGSDGNPLAGIDVTFTAEGAPGMAVQLEPSGASPCIVTTDEQGVATLEKMGGYGVVTYYADGPFTVTATYGDASQIFSLVTGVELTPQ